MPDKRSFIVPSDEPPKAQPISYASNDDGYQQSIHNGRLAVVYSVVAMSCSVVLLLSGWGELHYHDFHLEYLGILWIPLLACVFKSVSCAIKSLKDHRSHTQGTRAILLSIVSLMVFGLWLIVFGNEGK
jgi:hypothetical protein